eukprot:3973648-Pyramimonas_sp.AAC.1
MVAKTCPIGLRRFFPDLFPDAAQRPKDPSTFTFQSRVRGALRTFPVPPVLDAAPGGNPCFVYLQQKGEHPVCRLEMKFPRQKDLFFLRH